jgi:phospholipase C
MQLSVATLGLGFILCTAARSQTSYINNIKNVVVLVQENRSFDTLAGGFTYNATIDGLVNHTYCNPADTLRSTSSNFCAADTAKNIVIISPDHSITGGNMQIFGEYHPSTDANSSMNGFITEQNRIYHLKNKPVVTEVINYYNPDLVPVTNAMAENFVLFDRWFASVPGASNPNRAYLTSGTSYGQGQDKGLFYHSGLPQTSIFQQLSEKNVTWINYENTTNLGKSSSPPDSLFYKWTTKSGKSKTNVLPIDRFYQDAKSGALPQFTWINPECCKYMSMHPKSPVNMGENFMKGIYDTLRSSPQWNQTLLIITWDEHGGFGDHVPPPTGVPAGDHLTYTEKAPDGKKYKFHFDRLGVRVPTILISPWVEKGLIQKRPKSGNNDFTHTSILKFVSELWGLDSLSPRVEWSPSFSDLITNHLRNDTPREMPNAAGY